MTIVLTGPASPFWLLRDVFDTHPSGIDEERCINAFVDLAAEQFGGDAETTRNESEIPQ